MHNVVAVNFTRGVRLDYIPDSYLRPRDSLPTEAEMKAEIRGEKPKRARKKTVREECAGLSYYPRLKLWKGSGGKLIFNPETMEATSYGWWEFVSRINGRVVFNWNNYSNTTRKHQWAMWMFLRERGIKIDLEIESPDGLQKLESAIWLYEGRIRRLREEIARKGSRKAKNAERVVEIERLGALIFKVHGLMQKND